MAETRRDFLKVTGAGIVGLAVGAAAGYYLAPPKIVEKPVPQKPPEVPKEPLKIGVITILSGPGALLFDPGLKALQMEVEKINANGGILGRKIELSIKDSGGKPENSVDFFRRLVEEEGVEFVISGSTSAEAIALAPVAEQKKQVLIIEEGTVAKLFEEVDTNPKYVFRINNYDILDSTSLAIAMKKIWPDVKKFAVIGADYAWGHDTWDILKGAIEKLYPDMEVVAETWPPLFSQDFSSHISTVIAAKPDVVALVLWGGDLVTCIKQGVQYGLFKDIKGISPTGGEYVWAAGTDTPDNLLMSTRYYFTYPPWDKWWPNREFNLEFHNRYPDSHGGWPGFNCNSSYYAIHFLKAAIERAYAIYGGWPTQEQVTEALEGLMIPGPGGYRYIRPEDHQSLGYAITGLTKQDPRYGFAILDPIEAVPPEEMAPPPGVKWKDWIKHWGEEYL
ncbi:hypothetical protein DRN84_01840 [Candidatus Geothermarchaeota archaeon]|nr:MAG: hypothetical protein DRN87_00690 [Candidatus Geothermarchaeota archaeon]RLG62476.1 MAG: hypothetical protein DRN84_01840 [Candidatus Geothermarchaeota archaeon]HEW93424.1 twin-arginine translocation signal domain-containing protein [Thermoprotei archaeon]